MTWEVWTRKGQSRGLRKRKDTTQTRTTGVPGTFFPGQECGCAVVFFSVIVQILTHVCAEGLELPLVPVIPHRAEQSVRSWPCPRLAPGHQRAGRLESQNQALSWLLGPHEDLDPDPDPDPHAPPFAARPASG